MMSTDPTDRPPNTLSEAQVRHVAKLSRLDLSDEQIHRFSQQLSTVLAHVSKLEELDVTGVEPMAHATDLTNTTRDDRPVAGLGVDEVLANAPQKSPPFFCVPKVLGEEPSGT